MPKKRAARRTVAKRNRRRAVGKVLLVALALCLTVSALTLAGWGRIGGHPAARQDDDDIAPPAPPASSGNFNPASPAKEYVYAGGRLVATEEPQPTPDCTSSTALIISEFRLRGAAGPKDEFVEFYNNSDSTVMVCPADGSAGWALSARSADGTSFATVFVIPSGIAIPARGHYLAVNASPSGGYSLSNHPAGGGTTATGDITYTTDIEDNSGIALFGTANQANFSAATRLDAAGFGGATGAIPDLYREGGGLSSVGTQNGNYTLYRKMTSASNGLPQDTGNNASDFQLVSPDGGFYGSVQASLGAPGPENLSSPVWRTGPVLMTNIDPSVGSSSPPNRFRDFTMVQNGTFGTLSLRRTVTNNTGANVTQLRFRLVSLTTYPVPTGVADLRALTSPDIQVQVQGVWRTVKGTTLEQPPAQVNGGGFNSAMSVALPQPLAPGASVDVQFLLGLQQTGSFSFLINIEALP